MKSPRNPKPCEVPVHQRPKARRRKQRRKWFVLPSFWLTRWWFQIFLVFSPRNLGKIPILTSIFFRWVETTNQLSQSPFFLGFSRWGESHGGSGNTDTHTHKHKKNRTGVYIVVLYMKVFFTHAHIYIYIHII